MGAVQNGGSKGLIACPQHATRPAFRTRRRLFIHWPLSCRLAILALRIRGPIPPVLPGPVIFGLVDMRHGFYHLATHFILISAHYAGGNQGHGERQDAAVKFAVEFHALHSRRNPAVSQSRQAFKLPSNGMGIRYSTLDVARSSRPCSGAGRERGREAGGGPTAGVKSWADAISVPVGAKKDAS